MPAIVGAFLLFLAHPLCRLGPLEDKSDKPGYHYVDQQKFSIDQALPLHAKKGDVVIFSYLLVHGSYINQ